MSKKSDTLAFLIFLFILLLLVIAYYISDRNSKNTSSSQKESSAHSQNFAGGLNSRERNTISMGALISADFLPVQKKRLIGAEFRMDLNDIVPNSSKNIIIFDKNKNLFNLRSALYNGKLVAVLSKQDPTGFEVIVDVLHKKFDNNVVIWQGIAFSGKTKKIQNAIILYTEDPQRNIPIKTDIIYAYSADAKRTKIKKIRHSNITFGL